MGGSYDASFFGVRHVIQEFLNLFFCYLFLTIGYSAYLRISVLIFLSLQKIIYRCS